MPKKEMRKLAAVMFTDITGYTALVQKDEGDALRKVAKHRKHLEALTAEYQGQVIAFYGDGSLSIYESVIDAVQCAVKMQHAYQDGEHVPVRIGIHLGDIVMKDGTVYGDGVNVASRIEAEGVPGSVLISEKVNRELHNHPEIGTKKLGLYNLKNVQDPTMIYAIESVGLAIPPKPKKILPRKKILASMVGLVALAFALQYVLRTNGPGSQPLAGSTFEDERIAVPPFANNTFNADLDRVGSMASHWITTSLIETVQAKVVSYEMAAERAKMSTPVALASVGGSSFSERTGAINSLSGSFNWYGTNRDSLIFRAYIENLSTGDILPISLDQPKCAVTNPGDCIEQMTSSIAGYWKSKSAKVLTFPKLEAYNEYLAAREMWTAKEDKIAVEHLNKAIQLDADFLDPYLLLLDHLWNNKDYDVAMDTINIIKQRFTNLTRRQDNYINYQEASALGRNTDAFKYFLKEYEIDPKDVFVNTSGMAMALGYVNDPDQMLNFYEDINLKTLDLNKCDYCAVRLMYAILAYRYKKQWTKGKKLVDKLLEYFDRRNHFKVAIEFLMHSGDTAAVNRILALAAEQGDNLSGGNYRYLSFIAARHAHLKGDAVSKVYYGNMAEALYREDSGTPDNPNMRSRRMLGRSLYLLDDLEGALQVYQGLTGQYRLLERTAELGMIYARLGDRVMAERAIEGLSGYIEEFDMGGPQYFQARIYLHLGETEKALDLLEYAQSRGSQFAPSLSYFDDPDLMSLNNNPRYQRLLDPEWK